MSCNMYCEIPELGLILCLCIMFVSSFLNCEFGGILSGGMVV